MGAIILGFPKKNKCTFFRGPIIRIAVFGALVETTRSFPVRSV